MIGRKRRVENPSQAIQDEQEERLVSAEKRANVLFEKADWLHTLVMRRDQENHWQASVNRLFLGGSS